MPLVTEIKRNGKPLEISWDWAHLGCMYTAALKEGDPELEFTEGKNFGGLPDGEWVDFSWVPIYYLKSKAPLIRYGKQTLLQRHVFDLGDDKKFVLKPGDVLRAWREFSK